MTKMRKEVCHLKRCPKMMGINHKVSLNFMIEIKKPPDCTIIRIGSWSCHSSSATELRK